MLAVHQLDLRFTKESENPISAATSSLVFIFGLNVKFPPTILSVMGNTWSSIGGAPYGVYRLFSN